MFSEQRTGNRISAHRFRMSMSMRWRFRVDCIECICEDRYATSVPSMCVFVWINNLFYRLYSDLIIHFDYIKVIFDGMQIMYGCRTYCRSHPFRASTVDTHTYTAQCAKHNSNWQKIHLNVICTSAVFGRNPICEIISSKSNIGHVICFVSFCIPSKYFPLNYYSVF